MVGYYIPPNGCNTDTCGLSCTASCSVTERTAKRYDISQNSKQRQKEKQERNKMTMNITLYSICTLSNFQIKRIIFHNFHSILSCLVATILNFVPLGLILKIN